MVRPFAVALLLAFVSFSSLAAEPRWTFNTAGAIHSSPLIDGDRLYFGNGDGVFYALDKHTGEPAWRFQTGGAVHSSASIDGGRIYFASADGTVYALNKHTGKEAWRFISAGEKTYGLWDFYLSTPTAHEGVVYWGSGDGHVYALEAGSGRLAWKYQTGDIVHATPVIHEDRVIVGSFDGHVYALDKATGVVKWRFKTVGARYFPKGEIQRAVWVDEGVVYFGSRDYNIYALDVETGRGMWNMKEPDGWIIATPVSDQEDLYFGTSDGHRFYSMDKSSGGVNWTTPLRMRVFGSAVIADERVYFGTFDGKVLGLNRETGEQEWAFQTEGSRRNYDTVFKEDGTFRDDFKLYGADYDKTEKMILALGSVLSTPAVDEGVIYFGSRDGNLYAVELP